MKQTLTSLAFICLTTLAGGPSAVYANPDAYVQVSNRDSPIERIVEDLVYPRDYRYNRRRHIEEGCWHRHDGQRHYHSHGNCRHDDHNWNRNRDWDRDNRHDRGWDRDNRHDRGWDNDKRRW